MWSLRFLVAAAGIAALWCATRAGAAPRAGKVVRVERRPAGFTGHPRFCSVHPGDMFGHCIGTRAPEVGDRMTAIDNNRVLGVLRVTEVRPYNDGCQQTYQWMIQTIVDSGDLSSARGTVLGLSDVPLDPRNARLVNVDRSPTGHAWGTDTIYAVDTNADSTVEIEFISYQCDDFSNATQAAATSNCQEVWAVQPGRGLERLRHDRFRVCF